MASLRGNKDGVNVQVILRCRPFSRAELNRAEANRQFVQCKEEHREVSVFMSAGGNKQLERSFHFDKVFGPESGQDRLYKQAVAPIVEEVLEGFNCTIFAYGQTGTGKTYTMEGGDRDSADGNNLSDVAGVIPRAIHQIFTTLDHNDSEYTVKCSFLELYNEETTDLLAVGERQDQKLRIMEDRSGVVIQGLEEFIVKTSVDIYALLDRGSAKRKTAETQLNKQSSRSHSVFCITVHMREIAADGEEVIKIGKLYLVDLAGSENVSRSGAAGTMAKEAGSINKSLLTLGRVITALVEGSGHIPYRDSKLTRLLRDSLGGKTKTCIIATIAPTAHCQDETLSTLDYAHRAKNIRNRPEVNQKISKTAHIKELNAEIDRLKAELFATREKNGVYLPVDQFEQREAFSQNNVARLESLEAELEQVAAKHKAHTEKFVSEISRLQQELAETADACQKARLGIQERDFLIATHNRSESAIIAQASSLTEELHQASSAINSLYERLEENVQREQGNAAVIQTLRQSCENRFAAMLSAFSTAMSDAQGCLQQASLQLGTFLQEKDGQLAAMQGRLKGLQSQLTVVLTTADTATGAIRDAAVHSLNNLHQVETDFAASMRETAVQADMANAVVFQSMADTHLAHQNLLEAAAVDQQEVAAAFMASVHGTAERGKEGVRGLAAAATDCYQIADSNIAAQNKELANFKERFAMTLSAERDSLLTAIGSMLGEFAAKREAEVDSAIDQIAQANQETVFSLNARSEELQGSANSAEEALKTEELKAVAANSAFAAKRGEHETHLQTTMQQSRTHCEMLQMQLQQSSSTAAQNRESHLASVGDFVAAGTEAVTEQVGQARQDCAAAVAYVEEGHKQMAEACSSDAAADKAFASQNLQLATKTNTDLSGFATIHQDSISQLASGVQKSTAEDFQQDPHSGDVVAKTDLKLPPLSWFEEMRTPDAETLLAEFRRQTEGLVAAPPVADHNSNSKASSAPADEEMADAVEPQIKKEGTENADPNAGVEEAVAPKSRIPTFRDRSHDGGEPRAAEQGGRRKRMKA